MTADDFRALALAVAGAEEKSHFGKPDFRCRGKIFASLGPEPGLATLKLLPEEQEMLLSAEPGLARPAAGAWGRQGWTRLDLGKADRATLADLVARAARNVAQAPRRRPAGRRRQQAI